MIVKNIIKKVANLTGDTILRDAIESNTLSTEQQKEISLLVDCVNLTNSNIATNYVKLYATKKIVSYSDLITYSSITNETIYDIVSVKNSYGKDVNFSLTTSGIEVKAGTYYVRYTYFPKDVEYEDEITNFPLKISERIFVYGVVSEYLYVKGVFDEAQMWEEKFKLEMKNTQRQQKNLKIKSSRWF